MKYYCNIFFSQCINCFLCIYKYYVGKEILKHGGESVKKTPLPSADARKRSTIRTR